MAAIAPFIWTTAVDLPHRVERVLPSAGVQLLFNLDADHLHWIDGPDPAQAQRHRLGGAAISGPFDHAFCIDTHDQRRLIGAVLPEGTAHAWLKVPMHALARTHIAVDDVPALRGLRQRLLETPWSDVPTILAAELDRRLAPDPPSRVVEYAVQALSDGARVRDVEHALGMSPKRLRRLFIAAVGLTPKRFQRVHRFRRTVQRIAAGSLGPSGLATVALDAGYSDQAHMTHEFRTLGATTPAACLPRAAADIGHGAV